MNVYERIVVCVCVRGVECGEGTMRGERRRPRERESKNEGPRSY